ncbi:Sin-like protein conserved region-domain-containing protein [Chytriomyces sp. MP71]|nr:Sin-like protein conserved region-domain-containing protein [Chytriomyces sp. MP71]
METDHAAREEDADDHVLSKHEEEGREEEDEDEEEDQPLFDDDDEEEDEDADNNNNNKDSNSNFLNNNRAKLDSEDTAPDTTAIEQDQVKEEDHEDVHDPMDHDAMDSTATTATNAHSHGLDLHHQQQEEQEQEVEEDPVVQEIPVFLSLGLDGLVLMQHPATRKHHPMQGLAALRVKPVAHRFEVDVAINTDSNNYNDDTAERLGTGLDNEEIQTAYDKRDTETKRKLLDKITLQSTLIPPTGGQYLIGALRDDEFHLTPLASIIQLRPSLRYLDKIQEKEKAATAKIAQHELNLENPDKKPDAPVERGVNVSVRVLEDNPEALRKAREVEEERRYQMEEWVNLTVFDERTAESDETYERLFSMGDELTYSFSNHDYLESIGPKLSSSAKLEIERDIKGSNVKPHWSMDDLMNLPLPALLRSLMIHANVVSFSKIVELTYGQFNEQDIVEELEKIAVLVRGVWIVRSELLYTGRVADARRYLLHLLSRSSAKPISRHDVNRVARLPHSVITNLFIELCARNPVVDAVHTGQVSECGFGVAVGPALWGLKVLPDMAFLERFASVVVRQRGVVEMEGERALAALEHRGGVGKGVGKGEYGGSTGTPVGRGVAAGHSASSATSAAPASRGASAGPKSRGGAAVGASAAPSGPSASGSVAAAATATTGVAASATLFKLSGGTVEKQVENLILDAFFKFGVCSEAYLVDLVVRHKEVRGNGDENLVDSEDVTPDFVRNALRPLSAKVQTGLVRKSVGAATDEFRDPIVKLFNTRTTVRKADVTNACQTATGKNISQSMYTKIMKELAVSGGTAWELRKSPGV